jgi:CBS domain containing-hemolysin-like protein
MDLVHIATWVGIFFCLSQSAMFSGMNLAAFSISRLRLEVQVAAGNRLAQKTLALRRDANFLLTTILWGNVGINVLLTLLSDSVMTGVLALSPVPICWGVSCGASSGLRQRANSPIPKKRSTGTDDPGKCW